jgi:hypothetical protein
MRRFGAVLVFACLALQGCGQLTLRLGARPPVERLEGDLIIGQSSSADVVTVLGQPTSRGRSQLPVDPEGKIYTLWTYYYGEAEIENLSGKDARGLTLYVYLDGDRYYGYLWFSSLRGPPGVSVPSGRGSELPEPK